jgi:CDP-2,3-bis-(O-geranylgeranyl)-sn-glycerol synthase
MSDVIFTFWLFLPAGIANMAPVFAAHWGVLKSLDRPIDRGRSWRGYRLFGDHKTFRGYFAGWIAALIVVLIQSAVGFFTDANPVDLSTISPLAWGTVLSLGALGGDTIKSFFKRRIEIQPGKAWVPFDQIDYVIGALLASTLLITLPAKYYLIAFLLGATLHPISTIIGWFMRLKEEPI